MKRIALIVENSREYGRGIVRGIAAFGQERRDWLLRLLMPADIGHRGALSEFDGIIARIADASTLQILERCRVPVVDVFCHFDNHRFVRVETNHDRVGRLAAEYFLSKGYSSFAYCGHSGTTYSDIRRDAFASRLAESGASCSVYELDEPPDDSVVFNETPDRPKNARSLARWFRSLKTPTALFCANDLRALQLLQIANGIGIDVPRDAAILGVDNDPLLCTFSTPPLSSIDPNSFGVGYAAARLLQSAMDNPPCKKSRPPFLVTPGELFERASTEHHPVTPQWFAEALVHIDRNISRTISACDVIRVAGKSSTAVERRFRAAFGMSIGKYIMSVKMKDAQRLLSRGRLSVKEVAARTGFNSPQYFCRSYRSFFGHPPLGTQVQPRTSDRNRSA